MSQAQQQPPSRQRDARRGPLRRIAWIAVALTAALLLILLVVRLAPSGGRDSTEPAGVIESLEGTVWVRGTDTPVSRFLVEGYAVPVGSGLRSSRNGRATIRLASGQSLRLDPSTQVRLLGDGRVALDGGTIHVDSGVASTGLTVTTPFGEIRDAGAQFEARLRNDELRIRLHEGVAHLVREEGELRILVGSELAVGENGDSPH